MLRLLLLLKQGCGQRALPGTCMPIPDGSDLQKLRSVQSTQHSEQHKLSSELDAAHLMVWVAAGCLHAQEELCGLLHTLPSAAGLEQARVGVAGSQRALRMCLVQQLQRLAQHVLAYARGHQGAAQPQPQTSLRMS